MSRTISKEEALASGDEADLRYLHERGRVSTEEVAAALGVREGKLHAAITEAGGRDTPIEDKPNTGDANTSGHTIASHEAMVDRMRYDQGVDSDDDDEPLVLPEDYASANNDLLRAEISRRNESRDEDDQLSLSGKKADLIATLEADDAGDEEE